MKYKSNAVIITILCLLGLVAANTFFVYAPDIGQPGGPINGLSLLQLKKFYQCREVFKKKFSIKEGLGPLYNADSCYSCHGQPGIAGNQGAGPKDSLTYIASPVKPLTKEQVSAATIGFKDSDFHVYDGGPIIMTKSVTSEFPKHFAQDCLLRAGSIPKGSVFITSRWAPSLWGMGLIDAIGEENIEDLELKQADDNLSTAGFTVSHRDRITHQDRVGRFGYKNQYTGLVDAVADQMNTTLGITTKYERTVRTTDVDYNVPECLRSYLPEEPNDNGALLAKLNYFIALSSPPPTGTINAATNRGRLTFEKLGCAACHVPTLSTAPEYYILDPDSQFPTKRYLRVQALENREVNAYSDLLLHNMGAELADGIATTGGVSGGQFRTAPLWGLRYRKYYLHDGRTNDLAKAILAHGGQGQFSRAKFASLPQQEKSDLLLFLNSL
ncbi:MAG: hypothetical protein K2X29_06350 [Candidatus Obscuribacterales bacterium]|nr:hypothetical protein [Candidatus Obscuribacterales bacterium]